MNKETFVTKAAAQQLNLSNININMLKPEHMELILEGKCICCGGDAPAEGIWDYDYSEEGRMSGSCIGYEQELFCDGCEDNIPAATLLAYGVISQQEYDTLCNPFEDEVCPPTEYWESKWNDNVDYDHENDLKRQWLSTYPDASTGYDEWLYEYEAKKQNQQSSAGGMHDCGDDELPF